MSAAQADLLARLRLGVTTTVALPDGDALRAWWSAAGLDDVATLRLTPRPQLRCGPHRWSVAFGAGLAGDVLDLRFAGDTPPSGVGFVGVLAAPVIAWAELGQPNACGLGPAGDAGALLALLDRLVARPDVDGTIAGHAGNLWLPAGEWRRRRGDDERNPLPVEAWLDVAFGPPQDGVLRLRSFGMAALGLPDVEVDEPAAADDDDTHELAQALAWTACRILLGEDARAGVVPHEVFPEGALVRVWLHDEPFEIEVRASAPGASVIVLGPPARPAPDAHAP